MMPFFIGKEMGSEKKRKYVDEYNMHKPKHTFIHKYDYKVMVDIDIYLKVALCLNVIESRKILHFIFAHI